jgi:virulence-associated protein VagC
VYIRTMSVTRKTFKVGQDVGVRLPKAWAIAPGTEFNVERVGEAVVLSPLGEPPLTPDERMAIVPKSIGRRP